MRTLLVTKIFSSLNITYTDENKSSLKIKSYIYQYIISDESKFLTKSFILI